MLYHTDKHKRRSACLKATELLYSLSIDFGLKSRLIYMHNPVVLEKDPTDIKKFINRVYPNEFKIMALSFTCVRFEQH